MQTTYSKYFIAIVLSNSFKVTFCPYASENLDQFMYLTNQAESLKFLITSCSQENITIHLQNCSNYIYSYKTHGFWSKSTIFLIYHFNEETVVRIKIYHYEAWSKEKEMIAHEKVLQIQTKLGKDKQGKLRCFKLVIFT